jgi:nitrite reductase/ring-hydroxylating ferredoxin subunit
MRHIDLLVSDIPADKPLRLENGRSGIVVIRTAEHVAAYEDSCPHAQWRLSDGEIVGGVLECPGHTWEFCTTTGQCLNVPAYRLRPISTVRVGPYARFLLDSDAPSAVTDAERVFDAASV